MASRGVNKVILVGNVGKDPEVRYTPGGSAIANLTLATSETWKDKNTGQPQEKTEWHRVVFFNRLAEIAGEYVRKGAKLYVEGSLRTRSWEQDGITRYATEIVASEMQMLGGRESSDSDGSRYQSSAGSSSPEASRSRQDAGSSNQAARQAPPQPSFDNFDDDIPF